MAFYTVDMILEPTAPLSVSILAQVLFGKNCVRTSAPVHVLATYPVLAMNNGKWVFVPARSRTKSPGKGFGKGKEWQSKPGKAEGGRGSGHQGHGIIACRNQDCTGSCPIAKIRDNTVCRICHEPFAAPPGAKPAAKSKASPPPGQYASKAQTPSVSAGTPALADHAATLRAVAAIMGESNPDDSQHLLDKASAIEEASVKPGARLNASNAKVQHALRVQNDASNKLTRAHDKFLGLAKQMDDQFANANKHSSLRRRHR